MHSLTLSDGDCLARRAGRHQRSALARLSGMGKAEIAVGEEGDGAAAPSFPATRGWAMMGAGEKGQGSVLGEAGSPPGLRHHLGVLKVKPSPKF